MGRQPELVGRRDELATLRAADGAALVVLRGQTGSGRTAVLTQVRRELTDRGFVALEVSGAAAAWDRFGVRPVLDAIREQFENLGDARLTEMIRVLCRLTTEATYASALGRFRLANALGTIFARMGSAVAVVADDIDRLAQPIHVLAAARRAGHLVIAATGTGGESAQLCELADQVVELGPLSTADADSVLRQVAGAPVDGALRQALRDSLGALYENPGTLVSTMDELRQRGRLVAVHGHLCLRDPRQPIALPAGHWLLGEVAACGNVGRELVLLAAGSADFGIDEIPALAAATGRLALEYGRVADRLVLAGVLDVDEVGRLRVRCPALGAAVSAHDTESPHRAIALRLLDSGAPGSPSVLAGHVAAAGRALPPRPELADLLRGNQLLRSPADTAHRYAAWWHTEPGEQRAETATDLVRLLVRAAEFPRLATFVDELAEEDHDVATLAAAAALAAVHIGHPVGEPVRAAISGTAALEFCDRWFAGAPIRLRDVETAFAPLRHSPDLPTIEWGARRRTASADIEVALAMRDLVPVFEAVLGADYGAPADGPLATYHRVCADYAGGDWEAALSAARELELDPRADALARQSARLHAAEMCVWRGEDRRATAWLDSVSEEDCAFPVLYGWVVAGLRTHAGDLTGALRVCWRTHAANQDGAPGLSQLLRRMAAIAMRSGEQLQARRVHNEAERRYSRQNSPDTLETVRYVRGLVNSDDAEARAAEELIRRRGNRFEMAMACHLVGATATEPRPWLAEALQIAQAIGATRLTTYTKRSLAGRGIAISAPRDRREGLSETELRIIELVRVGRTNRQIAHTVRMSEKTVEKHLTRLFAKAGCRTRHGLATSALGGQPEPLGA
jgi:DNA-binding CsgD family transcriptional regulator